jgi:transposase
MAFVLTAGQRHETTAFERLMDQGSVKRAGCARSKVRPRRVIGDKSYSSKEIRRYLRRRGIRITIPRKTNERRGGPFDRAIYRMRNRIERLINRLKQFRRVATRSTRYEKRAENYLAMLTIAAIILWL